MTHYALGLSTAPVSPVTCTAYSFPLRSFKRCLKGLFSSDSVAVTLLQAGLSNKDTGNAQVMTEEHPFRTMRSHTVYNLSNRNNFERYLKTAKLCCSLLLCTVEYGS